MVAHASTPNARPGLEIVAELEVQLRVDFDPSQHQRWLGPSGQLEKRARALLAHGAARRAVRAATA